MRKKTKTPTPKPTRAPVIIASLLAVAATGTAIHQNHAVNELRYDAGALTAQLTTTQADLERATSRLESSQTQILDLTAQVARFDPEEVTTLEQRLATAEADAAALGAELAAAQQALTEKEAAIAELTSEALPPPPAAEVLAPPPLYAAADFGDPHVDVALDQYLSELLATLSDDSKAPELAAVHPLGVLYDEERELLVQGTVGDGQRYRVTEWHTLNEYEDVVLASLVIIDAPEGTNAAMRVQQALTATRGAGKPDDAGMLTWQVGSKTVTLRLATSNASRASLEVRDSYQLPDVMQVYNRQ